MTVSVGRKISAVVVPWIFLAAFAALYITLVLPRALSGNVLALCVGAFIAFVFVVFFVAAVTFSRDVLQNRWP